jgi:hypothetical protein
VFSRPKIAKLLEIKSYEVFRVDRWPSKQYSVNLKARTAAIDSLWNAFLREKYNPTDPQNEELLNQTNTTLNLFNQERSKLCMEAAQILAKKHESWLSHWTFGLW